MASFYFFFLPLAIAVPLWKTKVAMSCSSFNMTLLFSTLATFLSSTSNPIICFTFVESYRRGLREMFDSFRRSNFKTGNIETGGLKEITHQRIRVVHEIEENVASYRDVKDDGVNLAFKQN